MIHETYSTSGVSATVKNKALNILNENQVSSFMERGYCVVKQAFTSEQAEAVKELVWHRMNEKAGIKKMIVIPGRLFMT